jgi:hypothetical protein
MHCNYYVNFNIILGIPNQLPDCDLPMAIIIVMSLLSSGSVAIVIVLILMLVRSRVHKRIQYPLSTRVNNPIYEEPDHHINTDQTIAISDNVAYTYSVTKFQERQANIQI